nr:unnamed protein product [Callosobruchus chinensis]
MTGDRKHVCPLLKNPDAYNPDTIDLINNTKERNYWLPCLEVMVKKFIEKIEYLVPNDPEAKEKAELCYNKFHTLSEQLLENPKALPSLSIRTLLEYCETNQRVYFEDAWKLQKEKEYGHALLRFKNRINFIDSINNFDEKWLELTKGVLAGNVFDWGARAVAEILEQEQNFGFGDALKTIQKRPWFCDKIDMWVDRLKQDPYKTCVIFVDNAGYDFVLGILPMTRELLSHGTKVVLAANSFPTLNDVTYEELNVYCSEAAQYCDIIKNALKEGQLLKMENGQRGPCLDLRTLTPELCEAMEPADLLILEGMGRAVHTNLRARFTVDCAKLAVLKNEWLAQSLGAQQFAVVCSYESAT